MAIGAKDVNDYLNKMIAYEDGELDEAETAELFQNLIDTGIVWELQGSYGREAVRLIEAGLCHEKE